MAAGTSVSLLFIRTTSAASMAISVPAPMAIPISALVRAGASLMPSPTIATFPFFFRERITLSFPSGSTPAMTSSTPAWAPIALAVRSLSPVSMTTWIPMFCSSLIASGLSSFITSATAIIPISFRSLLKNRGVFPSSASLSAVSFILSDISAFWLMKFRFPPQIRDPFTLPESPLPGTAWKSSVSNFSKEGVSSAFTRIA